MELQDVLSDIADAIVAIDELRMPFKAFQAGRDRTANRNLFDKLSNGCTPSLVMQEESALDGHRTCSFPGHGPWRSSLRDRG
jgi:hypothetical protein